MLSVLCIHDDHIHSRQGKLERNRTRESGFTLIELLVVMAILVLLASLIAPRVIGYLGSSRTKTAILQIENLSTSVELFKLDTGRYPTTQEGIGALVKSSQGIPYWNGPYLKRGRVPKDPWGRPYHYRSPGTNGPFEIYSWGADGKRGGTGEQQDVSGG